MDSQRREGWIGLAFAVAAFSAWGLAPIYFKSLRPIQATEIVAHRVIWSVALLALLIQFSKKWRSVQEALTASKSLRVFALTTVLISANWLLFIWAINNGMLLQGSLGYFINPLVNVLLGVAFLKERLSRVQKIAVALAAIGVLNLVVASGTVPWVSLCLALTFGFYGLLRKQVAVESTVGLFIETLMMTPFALGWLAYLSSQGALAFGAVGVEKSVLLSLAGVITALPLLWFVAGAKRLRLATLGLVQYLAPTGQFLLAVVLYDEPFTAAHAVTFGLIWTSLAIYSVDALKAVRTVATPRAT